MHLFFLFGHDGLLLLGLLGLFGALGRASCSLTLGVLALNFTSHIILKDLNLLLLLRLFFYFGFVVVERLSLFI